MSTITLLRLYLRMQGMPRLPLIGNAGILYSSPLTDRHRSMYREETGRTCGMPEIATSGAGLLVKKGSMGNYNFRRVYSTSTQDITKAEKERLEKNKFKLKTAETIKILLVSETGSISGVTLNEANKISKKKGLHLVHIENERDKPVKSEKEIYKLVSNIGILEESSTDEKESPSKQKELKTTMLKSNIGEHDATSKINNMKKWITKGHRVRVVIGQAGEKGDAETVYQLISDRMTEVDGQIQQKVKKGNEIRFYVAPPKNKPETQSSKPTSKAKSVAHEEDDVDGDGGVEKPMEKKTRKT